MKPRRFRVVAASMARMDSIWVLEVDLDFLVSVERSLVFSWPFSEGLLPSDDRILVSQVISLCEPFEAVCDGGIGTDKDVGGIRRVWSLV